MLPCWERLATLRWLPGFNWVGDYVTFPNGSPQKIIAHALMGGLLAEADRQ
jgi:hypothetical protein